MISINPDRLYAGYGELKSVYGSLCTLSSTVLEIRNRLSNTSGMTSSIDLLNRANSNIGDYIEQCRRLCQGMDTVCQLYVSCENRVLDSGENAIIHYSQPSTTFVDLSATVDILHEFSFTKERDELPWLQVDLK